MRADLPHVEGAEQFLHPGVDAGHIVGGDQAPGDSGLVADDSGGYPVRPKRVQDRLGARHWGDPSWVPVVGHIDYQGPVPVEQDSAELGGYGASHTPSVPHCCCS
jgi:hypothetical protein